MTSLDPCLNLLMFYPQVQNPTVDILVPLNFRKFQPPPAIYTFFFYKQPSWSWWLSLEGKSFFDSTLPEMQFKRYNIHCGKQFFSRICLNRVSKLSARVKNQIAYLKKMCKVKKVVNLLFSCSTHWYISTLRFNAT